MTASLTDVLAALRRLAPLEYAEAWDNVGLLLEPTPLGATRPLRHVLLTIDLSDEVVSEAERLNAGLVVAYHPPIFQGLKRLRASVPTEGLLLRCAALGLPIFSPHTALDAVSGGVNDWLLGAFGPGVRGPLVPHPADGNVGQGRFVQLTTPISLLEAVVAIKHYLGLEFVRVSTAVAHEGEAKDEKRIRSIAVCAGAGGSLFEKVPHFDLFLTGEMRHHDVRARALSGSSVVLCEHTNTERGYLPLFAERLARELNQAVQVHVSQCDRDPLSVV